MKIKRALWMAGLCLPLVLMLAAGFGRDPHAVPSVLVGKAAPPFVLQGVGGEAVDLDAYRGRPVLLNFWATWCYPCQAEHPLLQALAKRLGQQLGVVGVIYQDEKQQVQRYLAEHPSPYPHGLDPNSQTAIDYGVAGVPESFIIDANGIVAYKHAGVLTPEIIAEHLVPLLPGRGALRPRDPPGPPDAAAVSK